MLAGLVIASRLNPDPQRIASALAAGAAAAPLARPLREVVARPRVAPVLLAVLAVWGAMLAVMVLTGKAMVDHGHGTSSIFPVLAAHLVGMFGLFAIVGPAIERIGPTRALVGGLLLLGASCAALTAAISSVALIGLVLFGVGLGWSLAIVAATAELSERSNPAERATLIGLSDLLGGMTGALLAVAGGIGLDAVGVGTVGLGAAALPLLAAAWIVRDAGRSSVLASAET